MPGWNRQIQVDEEGRREEAARRQAEARLNARFPYRIRGADWEWLKLPANPRPLESQR